MSGTIKVQLLDAGREDFGQIEVPLDERLDPPQLIKHRGRLFAYAGAHYEQPHDAGEEVDFLDELERERERAAKGPSVPHYEEIPGTNYHDHDAARGVVR